MESQLNSERFSRLSLILKEGGLEKLSQSTVMVLGLGGVGSSCAEALARGGIGKLILIDRDIVEESNINRQAIAFNSTIGKKKVDVMGEMIFEINPNCKVYKEQIFLQRDNIHEKLSSFPRPSYVVDCIDTVSPKLTIAKWAIEESLPLLSAMGAANKLDPSLLKFDYIENTRYCPLSKVMRRECRKRGIGKLEVLYSDEKPVNIEHKGSSDKALTLGSMSYMPPIMGMMLAGKVITRLAGLEDFRLTPNVKEIRKCPY